MIRLSFILLIIIFSCSNQGDSNNTNGSGPGSLTENTTKEPGEADADSSYSGDPDSGLRANDDKPRKGLTE